MLKNDKMKRIKIVVLLLAFNRLDTIKNLLMQ